MSARSLRLTAATLLAGLAATAAVATASPASAYALQSRNLQPGESVCVSQYASSDRGVAAAAGLPPRSCKF